MFSRRRNFCCEVLEPYFERLSDIERRLGRSTCTRGLGLKLDLLAPGNLQAVWW